MMRVSALILSLTSTYAHAGRGLRTKKSITLFLTSQLSSYNTRKFNEKSAYSSYTATSLEEMNGLLPNENVKVKVRVVSGVFECF